MKNIAVLVSGSGSNFQAIIDEIEKGNINGKIKLLISSNDTAYSLERAKKHNIKSLVFNKKAYESLDIMYSEMVRVLKKEGIDLIVLAGYLTILNSEIVSKYKNKIINIHPSLIPSFCGIGYYGLKVHEAAVAYGVKVSGATVHFVDECADTGAIILQDTVPVLASDSAEDLQKRILEIEHRLLPLAVQLFCDNKIKINGRVVEII